jgi:hypothetical protein
MRIFQLPSTGEAEAYWALATGAAPRSTKTPTASRATFARLAAS